MRAFAIGLGLALLTLGDADAQDEPIILTATKPYRNQQPYYPACPPGTVPVWPGDPSYPKFDPNISPKVDPKVDPNVEPKVDPGDMFAGATEAGTQPGAQFNPSMFGDLIGISGTRVVRTGTGSTVVARGIPISGRYQGFKVADNESPRPVDRVYFTYNHYGDVNRSILPSTIPSIDLQRQLLGFESTFLRGDASIGMRLPFIQVGGFTGADSHIVGDLSVIFKYAWINDRTTGNVASGGMILTLPTGGGDNFILADGSAAPHSTLFQPWVGFIYNLERTYFQGFSSIVIPTDSRDPTIFFNSIAAGYWLYRSNADRFLNGVVPVVELHANNPLNHRNRDDLIFFQDQVNVTAGSYFIFPRMTLGGAVCVPLVGPKPYSIEAVGSLNFRF